jgi:hypothetical protein
MDLPKWDTIYHIFCMSSCSQNFCTFQDKETDLPWSVRIELSLHIAKGLMYLNSQGEGTMIFFLSSVANPRMISCALLQIRIRIIFESCIRIRNKVKIQQLYGLKIEPWRAVYAHNEGLEAQSKK